MGGRGNAGFRNSETTVTSTTEETVTNKYGFEVENSNNPDIAFTDSFWKRMVELRKEGTFSDPYLEDAVDDRISELVDQYGDLERYDADLTSIRDRIDGHNVTYDEFWAGYHAMADILKIKTPRYSAGVGTGENFFFDTRFGSVEQAEEWGRNRDLTHIYDRVTGKYRKIGGKNWTKG